ncbi:protein-disulfide reductase DsbD domain-containing protein [Xanthobacter sp. AM11]|uniref:protein-disulfide reductase DsbD domain-containing protein n=1 Tax=Xanthobacter sp. AM11 TaxID=3380643 RepID=UPI0039BFDAF0
MRQLRAAGLWAFAAFTLSSAAAAAGEAPRASLAGAEVQLIAGAVEGDQAQAGIEIRLAPGWKTYWRYPGDSGVPPALTFEGSRNVLAVEMAWPAPRRFSDGAGGFSIGYKGNVLLPLKVRLAEPGKGAHLAITLDFAVCEALCMPARADLAVDLPGDGAGQARITAAGAGVPEPRPLGAEGLAVTAVALDSTTTPARLVIDVRTATAKADLFAEGPDARWALPLPQKTALPDGMARFSLPLEGVPPGVDPRGAQLELTLVDGAQAVATRVAVPAP